MAERLDRHTDAADALRENANDNYDLFGRFDQYQDDQERLNETITFGEYFKRVAENPYLARSAMRTVYDAVTNDPDFFTTGKNALYGAEESVKRFTDILQAGAEGLELGRRIILLVGPPGSGKSTLVNATKRGIEAYSRTDEGALYAIDGCPINEDPMHLIPQDMREDLEEEYGVHIEGDLCPVCEQKYRNTPMGGAEFRDIAVNRLVLSEKKRNGIGRFDPADPKSQDMSQLIGGPNYRLAGKYDQDDARAYSFDGEVQRANRGAMEFVEMLKSDPQFLFITLDLAQDRTLKAPKMPIMSVDEVIIAHTNFAEYNRYMHEDRNEAMRDRIALVVCPYNLKVSDERKIHEKLIGQSKEVQSSGTHVSPLSLDVAANFAVLTRLHSNPKYSKRQKLHVYNGENYEGLTDHDLTELKEADEKLKLSEQEGMSGLSPRFVIDALSEVAIREGRDKHCITPGDTLTALQRNLGHHPYTRQMDAEAKQALQDDLADAKREYDNAALREVQSAFIESYEDMAQTMCENYLENIAAYCNKEKIVDETTHEEREPSEKLMRSIEERIQINPNSKDTFRREIMAKLASATIKNKPFGYHSHPQLKKAIESKLFSSMKDTIKLTLDSTVPNKKREQRINEVEQTLVQERGYCEHCARELIRYVGALISQDDEQEE